MEIRVKIVIIREKNEIGPNLKYHKGIAHDTILQWLNIRFWNPRPMFKYMVIHSRAVLTAREIFRFIQMAPESTALYQKMIIWSL